MTTFEVACVPDSFLALKSTPDSTYDVTITDPPYTEHVHRNLRSGGDYGKKSVPNQSLDFAHVDGFEFAKDFVRVSKRWSVAFCSLESLGLIQAQIPREFIRGGVWLKPNSMGQLTGDRPACAFEGVAIMHRKGRKRWNGHGSYGVWTCNGTRGKKDRHPNEKPLNLALKLVALFSDRGETVFDPFCGSGAIGEACVRLGRKYVGWDQNQAWVDRTIERLTRLTDADLVDDESALRLCRPWGKAEK